MRNAGKLAGDEVVEAFLKTPQADGPIRSLAGFERIHLAADKIRDVTLTFDDRALSSVSSSGERSVLPGSYDLAVGSAPPQDRVANVSAVFTVHGTMVLPKQPALRKGLLQCVASL